MMNLQPSHRGSYKVQFKLIAFVLFLKMDFIVCDFQIRPGTIFRVSKVVSFLRKLAISETKTRRLPYFFFLTPAHTFDEDRKADNFGRNHINVKIASTNRYQADFTKIPS